MPALGVGTNQWDVGESGQGRFRDTLTAALDVGMGFFDTAEGYNIGRSEIALGEAAREVAGRPCLPASSRHFHNELPRPSSRQRWKGR